MDSEVAMPCPICSVEGELKMRSHSAEIPYFGEHTQVTLLCDHCGWRQTDFIPADGAKPNGWNILVDDEEILRTRVVRSSSCTICIPELDLEVNPGTSNAGYVSNVEGVMNRFVDVIEMVSADFSPEHSASEIAECAEMLSRLNSIMNGDFSQPVSIELLDPRGHSQILHAEATPRDLTNEELASLPVGPDPAIFTA